MYIIPVYAVQAYVPNEKLRSTHLCAIWKIFSADTIEMRSRFQRCIKYGSVIVSDIAFVSD